MRIFIVRHGKTEYNNQMRMQGWSDSPLLSESVEMAKSLGEAFKREGLTFDKVYSSDLIRTVDTANAILDGLESELEVHELFDLREMHFGEAEALEFKELWTVVADYHGFENDEEILKTVNVNDRTNLIHQTPPYESAESRVQFDERVLKGLNYVVEENKDNGVENILIVAHGLTILSLINQVGANVSVERSFDNLSVSEIHYDEELKVVDINKMYI